MQIIHSILPLGVVIEHLVRQLVDKKMHKEPLLSH